LRAAAGELLQAVRESVERRVSTEH
jgi:hypothetical protein